MQNNTNTISWLKNGIVALAIAGLYSIILVILRTPQLSHFFQDKSVFKSALVIHVNLSVLVWLLAIACAVWSMSRVRVGIELLLSRLALFSMALMAFSPLYPESVPVMNNYVPMLENIVFILGLVLFGAVVLIFAVQTLLTSFMQTDFADSSERLLAIAKFTSAFMFVCAWLFCYWSFLGLDRLADIAPLDIDYYYEMLFWSGGHLLQFVFTQILMIALLMLAEGWKGQKLRYENIYEMLLVLNFLLGLAAVWGHVSYDVADGDFKEFFTRHMIYTGGIAPTLFIATLIVELLQKTNKSSPGFVKAAFVSSIILFLSGGLIGAIISGVNVTIPAHYHGSIVGISVAFMGLCYMACLGVDEKEGLVGLLNNYVFFSGKVYGEKAATWQLVLITIGQILHVAGLALAGGYGVMRKTPGGEIPLSAKVYMGMVGGGGLLAIIAGLMFVYICAKNLYPNKRH